MNSSIVLLAKQSGKTSFSSLWQVKNALGTKKVGHTGTLDNFADGLLVLLSGSLTRLCSYITACDKEYLARISFGAETDTLDPAGSVVKTAALPDISAVHTVIPDFIGSISQIPPDYSAIHVDGKRSSDRIRQGESVKLQPRLVTIHNIEFVSSHGADGTVNPERGPAVSADIRVHCSKGTYIRSLARDIGHAVGSCAHVSALRRTAVGHFRLEHAAGYRLLPEFGTTGASQAVIPVPNDEIESACIPFTEDTARETGLTVVKLKEQYHNAFMQGKRMANNWFHQPLLNDTHAAVFMRSVFCGIVREQGGRLVYDFVFRDS